MSIVDLPTTTEHGPRLKKFTRDEFYHLWESGMIASERVELLDGEIYEMAPQRDLHALAVVFADYALRRVFGDGFTIRIQLPFSINTISAPEPDVVVIAGSPRSQRGHPTSALLLVEVADTSWEYDRTKKARDYAAAGIDDYWIVNLNRRCIEVHRQPIYDVAQAIHRYADVQSFSPPDAVSPLAAPTTAIPVADFLP